MMMPSTFWFLTLTLTLSVGLLTSFVYSNAEVDALSALKRSLIDPGNKLKWWDSNSFDPCSWVYVTCNAQNRVTRLDMGRLNLAGKLAPELGNLAQLQYLELYQNKIQGGIPAELGQLTNLIALDLYENNLSGTLPSSLENLKALRFLRVNNNKLLTGPVPRGLLRVPDLDISNTGLTKPPASRPLV
ncbi:hypothetical protein M0R45_013622 [Rubus argutus]|uniref:Leucine-rich repeat-containing N-terminal plant-type domain-containing protein n=1 Tax=Rubus argutus TaxID=59490 RepID=A0AAW1XK95_RUBAR